MSPRLRPLTNRKCRELFIEAKHQPGQYAPGWPPLHVQDDQLVLGVPGSLGCTVGRWFTFGKRRVLGLLWTFDLDGQQPFDWALGHEMVTEGHHTKDGRWVPTTYQYVCRAHVVALPTLVGTPRELAAQLEAALPRLHTRVLTRTRTTRPRRWGFERLAFTYLLVLNRAAEWFALTGYEPTQPPRVDPRVYAGLTAVKMKLDTADDEDVASMKLIEKFARILRVKYPPHKKFIVPDKETADE